MAVSISSNSKFPKVFELKVSLKETSPVVWRTFLVHEIIPLDEIHMLIQMTMGWDDKQSYEFKFGEKSYGPADLANDAGFDSDDGVSLQDALGELNEFTYIYDHGDLWEHEVRIAQVLEHNPNITYPVCTGGENACPPEDIGGPAGYAELKRKLIGETSDKAEASAEKTEALKILGGYFNPFSFDPNFVNRYMLWADD